MDRITQLQNEIEQVSIRISQCVLCCSLLEAFQSHSPIHTCSMVQVLISSSVLVVDGNVPEHPVSLRKDEL